MPELMQLDPADRTPMRVYDGMLASHTAYKKDECLPCGAVIKMGFFFDAFGRHRDQDDPTTSRYSNICRLWEAHREMRDTKRQSDPNQFWYRYYYSGLGTPLNEDAKSCLGLSALKTGVATAKDATVSATKSVLRLKEPLEKLDVKSRTQDAVKESIAHFSVKPISKVFHDIVQVFHDIDQDGLKVPPYARRTWNVLNASPERLWRRTKAEGIVLLRRAARNPLKFAKQAVVSLFVNNVVEAVPIVADSATAAMLLGSGSETRIDAALRQFKDAYEEVHRQMPKVRTIEVSVFGADRGAVLARVFVNQLVKRYGQAPHGELSIEGAPITIRFLGLLDAVSSIMDEAAGTLISFVPVVAYVQGDFGNRALDVPACVQRCVHFGAAHELRFYQRLDSLEKTRGDQYLYPGTSENITGGSVPGSMGARAELQRVALQDMLHEALMAGAAIDTMEDLSVHKPDTFKKFTLAQPISDNAPQYKIRDLIEAYRMLIPREKGLNFVPHMCIFLRWMAVRYRDLAFRDAFAQPVLETQREADEARQQWMDAVAAFDQENLRLSEQRSMFKESSDADKRRWHELLAKKQAARQRHDVAREKVNKRYYTSLWERLEQEARMASEEYEVEKRLQARPDTPRPLAVPNYLDWPPGFAYSPPAPSEVEMALVEAWEKGLSGADPLPKEVMALFDLLVHDTLLTSWQDHLLAPRLYFAVRSTDTFGETDFKDEARKREHEQQAIRRIDQMSEIGDARKGTGLDSNFPI